MCVSLKKTWLYIVYETVKSLWHNWRLPLPNDIIYRISLLFINKENKMEDIFQWCREGNAMQVRVWLDDTEHDMNQG